MSDKKAVVDFDHYSRNYALNWVEICRDLRENTPVAWTEAHGGYWILSTYEDCRAAANDWRTFSSENDIAGTGNGGKGILIPRNSFQFALSESDPPQSTAIRNIELPYFLHNNVVKWEPVARRHADEALDAVIDKGRIDFALDIAMSVPAKTVLQLAGVPVSEWEVFAKSAHEMSYLPTSDPMYPHDKIAYVQKLMLSLIREQRAAPCEDIIGALVQGSIGGQPLSDAMVVGVLSAVVFAGFDTATATILNLLLYLNDRPDMRKRLLADPKAMAGAIEEVLRLTPPGHHLARTVMQDVVIKGQTLRKGDRVLMLWAAANRDPNKFERPDEFWVERPNAAQHLSFSIGPHRCLGSLLAKMEIRSVVEAILLRIGDYQIDVDKIERYPSFGGVAGFKTVPASFTPSGPLRSSANGAVGSHAGAV